ncbi:MAG: phosphodiester glycosidase family protein, partial [Anaerolineae bacterium]
DAQGAIVGTPSVRRLTDTPAGDEQPPVIGSGWLAYLTRVGGRCQSVTGIPLADLARRQVFVFDRPPEQVELHWRAVGDASFLVVAAQEEGAIKEALVDLAAGAVEPAGAGLAYVPAVRGEQSWLPNLVSRVRELPFVGPEKIAFLENVFFTLVDQVEQIAYKIVGRPPAEPVSDMPIVKEIAAANEAAPTPTDLPPTAPPPTATEAPAVTADHAVVPTMTAAATASPTARPDPTATSTAAPSPTPAGVRLADGIRHLGQVRPDPQRPYAAAEIVELDPALLQIKMVPGTIEPQPTTGLIGTGVIPKEDWPALIAAFNGGFAAMHGKFGMMVDRKVYLPPRDGIATLAVYEDGSLRMGTWGADLKQTADMVSYRQNCPPLIENGRITAETGKLTLWGLSVANEVYLYRSGLGITADGRLIYVAGKPLSAYTLARALQQAGAVYAMQLDVDEFHVVFITYTVKPGRAGEAPVVEGKKLRDDMRGFDGLFLRPFQLDFFYLVRRPQPLARPVRTAVEMQATSTPVTATLTSPATTGLPGRLAFASNRTGNYEIYVMPAAQPDAARRLTDHEADDLYPAWSPDGTQLAFASRRDSNAEIYVLRLADAALSRITHQPSEEWAPAWSPDGTRLAYQSDRNGQSDIYVSTVTATITGTVATHEVRLTPWQGNHESPKWSPDGRLIAFDSDLDVDQPVHASINLYLMGADGTNPRRIFPHAESPAWSPDGKALAFNGLRGGRWQIMVMNADGSGYRLLAAGRADARYPAWSPDGRWLAFAGNETGHQEIYAIPLAGGGPIRLTYGSADNTQPAWGK